MAGFGAGATVGVDLRHPLVWVAAGVVALWAVHHFIVAVPGGKAAPSP